MDEGLSTEVQSSQVEEALEAAFDELSLVAPPTVGQLLAKCQAENISVNEAAIKTFLRLKDSYAVYAPRPSRSKLQASMNRMTASKPGVIQG